MKQKPSQSQSKFNKARIPRKEKGHHEKESTPPEAKDIDHIFKSAKQQKIIQKEKADLKADQKKNKLQEKLKKQWKIEQQLRKAGQTSIPTATKAESGIKIYSEEELQIGKGGNTKLCPIDCQCCF